MYFGVCNTTFNRLEAASTQYKCLCFSPHPSVPDPSHVPNPEMIMSDGMVSAAVCVCLWCPQPGMGTWQHISVIHCQSK